MHNNVDKYILHALFSHRWKCFNHHLVCTVSNEVSLKIDQK